MAITPICDICKQELKDYGAILLGPPDTHGRTRKYHLCQTCYEQLVRDNNLPD